jgi:hypothetical protein
MTESDFDELSGLMCGKGKEKGDLEGAAGVEQAPMASLGAKDITKGGRRAIFEGLFEEAGQMMTLGNSAMNGLIKGKNDG